MRTDVAKNMVDVPPQIIAGINPPSGWITVDELAQNMLGKVPAVNPEEIKTSLNITLPLATRKSELLIREMSRRYEIKATEIYLTVDTVNSFHLVILLNRNDFLSPKMQAVRVLAEGMLNSNSSVSIRHTFSIDEEHLKAHSGAEGYKILHMAEA